jgi:hypothetical protein
MTSLPTKLRGTASTLIQKYGRDVVYTEVAGQQYSTSTMVTTQTPVTHNFKAVIGSPKEQSYIGGDVSLSEPVVLYVAAADISFVPKSGDKVEFGGNKYAVMGVDDTQLEGSTVLYSLMCGR